MAARGTVVVKFLGDASNLDRTLVGVEGRLGRMGGIASRFGRTAAFALGGAAVAGVGALGYALKGGIQNAAGLQTILGQTQAVLKSTGGAAGVTAKQVRDLANEINRKSLIDDDAVQQGENLLLTFTDIRNEVGKGNDIFTRATKTMADMSQALGQDTKSSAIQLGKALNDPIRGVTALRRVGVSFTQQQQDQIKTLVDSGKKLKAQKLILRELNKEFGGSAAKAGKSFAGAMFHLKDALSDTLRDALLPLLPSLTKLAQYLGKVLPGAMQSAIGWVKNTIASLSSGSGGLGGAADSVMGVLKTLGSTLIAIARNIIPPVLSAVKALGDFFAKNILPVLQGVAKFIQDTLAPAIGSILTAAFDGLKSALRTISGAIQSHRAQLSTLFGFIKKLAEFYVKTVAPVLRTVLPAAFKILGGAIAVAIDIVSALVDGFTVLKNFFTGPFGKAVAGMVTGFIGALKAMASAALTAFGVIVHGGSTMLGWVPGIGGKLKQAAAAFDIFKASVEGKLNALAASSAAAGSKAGKNYGDAWGKAATASILSALSNVRGGFTNLPGGITAPDQSSGGGRNSGGFHNGGGGGHPLVDSSRTGVVINIHNPKQETASDSIPMSVRKAMFLYGAPAYA